jgi:hypothetical protein
MGKNRVSATGSKIASEFRHEIQKMAIVGDKMWEKWMIHLAKPFYAINANSSILQISEKLGLGFGNNLCVE